MNLMKFGKGFDLLLNVILPLLIGVCIYWAGRSVHIPGLIRNYVPDGLWAYAFLSCILVVWDRKINWAWIAGALILSVIYEILQHYHIIGGTGDLGDVVAYLLFFAIALLSNSFFKTLTFNPILPL
jgi:hypothetical protein